MYENYQPLWTPEEDLVLRPGRSVTIPLGAMPADACRLFLTGETAAFYQWKNEPDEPSLYFRIDDALDAEAAEKEAYALHFQGTGADYPVRACTKAVWPPVLSYLALSAFTDSWTCGIRVRARDVRVGEGGYLRLRFEVREKKPGLPRTRGYGPADAVARIDFEEGTYGWRDVRRELTVPTDRTGNVFVCLEGRRFTGDVWFEAPFLTSSNGYNVIPSFDTYTGDRPQFDWMGQNLSRKEWPSFAVSLNGTEIHRGPVFERSHRYSEWQIRLPEGIAAEDNVLTVTLLGGGRDPLPYRLHGIGAVTVKDAYAPFRVVAVPEQVTAGAEFGVLVKASAPARIRWSSETVRLVSPPEVGAGLQVLRCRADAPGAHLSFTVNGFKREIRRSVLRKDDGVITGTGDMIYIDQTPADVEEYLSWYLAEGVGNLLTIRPTYRWSGCRQIDPSVWETVVRVLNGMNVKYAHMVDGREPPGANTNPSRALLDSPAFLGRQNHERDGAYAYWGYSEITGKPIAQMHCDLMIRMQEEFPEETSYGICPENLICVGDGGHGRTFRDPRIHNADGKEHLALNRNIYLPEDMEVMAGQFVEQLARTRRDAPRHTGPSTLFRYFYQAGYAWTGAETMYGPMEPVLAALRGASAAYGRPVTGVHHAVQWSTTPHDAEPRYRRYRLALYVSYMQGADEINTEEGLWHLEEYYHAHSRFSDACRNHLEQQRDFYRFVATHSRTGRFHTPIAFLQGRFDGWRVFGRDGVWGRPGLPCAAPEESWDLIRYYYPLSLMDAIYRHPCLEGPVGFHTGTPRGNIDIVPVEAASYAPYRLIATVGYNCARPEDLDKLLEAAGRGAAVLIGWPQLSTTTDRADVLALRHEYLRHPFVVRVAGTPEFTPQHKDGLPVLVGPGVPSADVLESTDEGMPLIYRVPVGAGSVVFVNAACYPADAALKDAWLRVLDRLTAETLAEEPVSVTADENVQYSVFLQEDGSRHVYLLAVDWWNPKDTPHRVLFTVGGFTYEIPVPWGILLKVVTDGRAAAWCDSEDGEVLSVSEAGITVQGAERCTFRAASGGTVRRYDPDLGSEPVQTISLEI